ncbi:MAG TPA: hypothetical protein VGK44_13170 [Casimicrobiaceae bacterium]
MTPSTRDLTARKELLTAQADLSRIQLALAWDDMRNSIVPSAQAPLFTGASKAAAFLVGIAAPLIGRTRFTRAVRYASIVMGIYRAIRSLRG